MALIALVPAAGLFAGIPVAESTVFAQPLLSAAKPNWFDQPPAPTVFDSKSKTVVGDAAWAGAATMPTSPTDASNDAVASDTIFLNFMNCDPFKRLLKGDRLKKSRTLVQKIDSPGMFGRSLQITRTYRHFVTFETDFTKHLSKCDNVSQSRLGLDETAFRYYLALKT